MNFDSTKQTISWFREQYRLGKLEIKPPFQRKPVWAEKQKCSLIETILLNLPVPEIYVQQITTPEGDETFAIVDGQQRMRTILQFIGSEMDADQQEHNKFVLDLLRDRSQWKGKAFADLTDGEKRAFFAYPLVVRYLHTDSDTEVRDMFRRLNRYLMPLKAQELRNATYSGPFMLLAQSLADEKYWAENGIVSPALIRRQNDVEFVSELLIGVLHGPRGGNSSIIDEYYAQYEDYDDEFPDQSRTKELFYSTLDLVKVLLPGIKSTRWSNKTDFYTLFVSLASLLRTRTFRIESAHSLSEALSLFAQGVENRLRDEEAHVPAYVVDYVRAVEKGANDKARRATRQRALLEVLEPYFLPIRDSVNELVISLPI